MLMRKLSPLIAVSIIVLLVSSVTATVQVKSSIVMKKIKDVEEKGLSLDKKKVLVLMQKILNRESFRALINKLSKQFNGKVVDVNIEKFREIIEKYRYLLKNKLGASVGIDSLKEKIKKILDKVEPQFIGALGFATLVYIIGWLATFVFYFITTPGAGWLERLGISLVAATIWPVVLLIWILA